MSLGLLRISLLLVGFSLYAQTHRFPFYMGKSQEKWVKKTLASLSLDQKIGQLFMVHAYSNGNKKQKEKVLQQIKDYHVGGLIFMKGSVKRQVQLTHQYQKASQLPLLIGLDAEWGLAMRLKNTFKFPWMMTLGATQNTDLSYQMAKEIGRQCRRIGVHINFAPVMDVNNNYKNPIIGTRSFSSNKQLVSQMGNAYIRGLQDAGVMACAKHFPGHGNTDKDSHKTLPTVQGSTSDIINMELFPFRKISHSANAIMIGHLLVPAYDAKKPASLSPKIVRQLLQKQMKYSGLVITDALNMKGVSANYAPGEIAVQAIKAGNDILLFPADLPKSIRAVKNAIKRGELTINEIEKRVRKILYAKYWCGLSKEKNIALNNLAKDLYQVKNRVIERKIYESAITLLSNPNDILPLDREKETGIIFLGKTESLPYKKTLNKLNINWKLLTDLQKTSKPSSWRTEIKKLKRRIKKFDQLILVILKSNQNPWVDQKLTQQEQQLITALSESHPKVVLNILGSPYTLKSLSPLKKNIPILLSYQSSSMAQSTSSQMLFGALAIKGKLPISFDKRFHFGQGLELPKTILGFSFPDAEGLDSINLYKVTPYIQKAIQNKAMPGAQLLIIRHGNIVLHQAYGNFTYKKKKAVTLKSIYDVASLTKILASVPLVMKMVEDFDISLNTPINKIYPSLKGTNKENLTLKQILSHTAGLEPWIPFYKRTLDSITKKIIPRFYSKTKTDDFSIPVAQNFYIHHTLRDSIQKIIYNSPLLPEPHTYKYSDLGYYIIKDIIEYKYQKNWNTLLMEHFIKPLRLKNMRYNPRYSIVLDRIIPSQEKDAFRPKGSMYGYVNDEGAAMLGGISGHAGIFSNVLDIGVMMQMFLNLGVYNQRRYFKEETFQKFNHAYYSPENRRGIGFDKPQTDPSQSGSTCGCVSMKSFGHFGFTGTYAWADPAQNVIIVFLSNRTYPDRKNNILSKQNIRTEIQRLVYLSLYEPV